MELGLSRGIRPVWTNTDKSDALCECCSQSHYVKGANKITYIGTIDALTLCVGLNKSTVLYCGNFILAQWETRFPKVSNEFLKMNHHAPLPHIQTPTITGQTKVVINILPTLFMRNVQFMFLWIWVYPTQACEKYITRQRRYHCQKFDLSILLNIYFLSLHIY